MSAQKSIKSAIESMMFIWGDPLPVKDISDVLNLSESEATEALDELAAEYEQERRGIRIRKVGKSYQFVTFEDNADYIDRLCTPVKKRRLSQAALEVLAIIAYKQPVTKGEIEAIRGVKSDRVLEGLREKQLVAEKGRATSIGRPILYATSEEFLRYFNLKSVKDLPEIRDIERAIEIPEEYADSVSVNQMSLEEMSIEAEKKGEVE